MRTDDLGGSIEPRRPDGARRASRASRRWPDRRSVGWFERRLRRWRARARQTLYAAYAYDCINLIALAAQAAGTDDAEPSPARDGRRQHGRVDAAAPSPTCAGLLAEGRNIDLDGASGASSCSDDGDAEWRHVTTCSAFDADGQDVDRAPAAGPTAR